MITSELSKRQRGEVEGYLTPKDADPFVFSKDLVYELRLIEFAQQILSWSNRLRPVLPKGPGGHPIEYSSATILVTLLVMAVWQLSPEAMVKRLCRWNELALACGYEPGHVISSSQLRRRRDQLGIWVYFLTFCGLVGVLIRQGALLGRDWVIDSTLMDAFSRKDGQAGWSFSKRFGYKVHMLICRDSLLPIFFLLTPANRNDAPWAIPLMTIALRLFALPVEFVRADAAYFTKAILVFVRDVLQAIPIIDFNPRKAGKRALATPEWVAAYHRQRGKRGYIERFFAVLKRYFRLNQLHGIGLYVAYRHAFEICISVLLVAWCAHHYGRPDLTHARSRLLAPC
jgi:hypothetical protein